MKGFTQWNQTPFTRLSETYKKTLPYVCAIAPFENGFTFEWFDFGSDGEHKVIVHKYETYDAPFEYALTDRRFTITGLDPYCEYEFTVWRSDMSASSSTRLVRTGRAGLDEGTVVVNYLHPDDESYKISGRYLGSPCIVKLPSGKLLCSMDLHSRIGGKNHAFIFKSEDNGETWNYVTELSPCFWGKLFVHRDKLYMLAVAGEYGDIIIGCSEDEGETWSAPAHIVHGVHRDYGGHKASVPVIEHNGRLYTAFEYGTWEEYNFYHCLLSIDADADLMKPENWIFTEPAPVKTGIEGMSQALYTVAIEGNAVVLPDDNVYVMLRFDPIHCLKWEINRTLLVKSNPEDLEAPLTFDRLVDMPAGVRNKFVIYKDPVTGYYFSVCNKWEPGYHCRWFLVLAVSKDCVNWTDVLTFADARKDVQYGVKGNGYSYPDFTFDGEDIIAVSRTAVNKPHGQHDNNYITFHRIKNYKQYIPEEH